jgi:L-2,4-diaminobutyrate decarboxylase
VNGGRFEGLFVDSERLAEAVGEVVRVLGQRPGPVSAIAPEDLRELVRDIAVCPDDGVAFSAVMDEVAAAVLDHAVRPSDPACAAHLHSPTLITAAAAELAIGTTNQSMDSYDQAPAATLVEDHLVDWLAETVGLPAAASGVLTAGGTASNLLGMLLARERSGPGCIVASSAAHFSLRRAAMVLGLGRDAVIAVATDSRGCIDVAALDEVLQRLDTEGRPIAAIVGTAGTTDLGAIDPLPALADRAGATGAWFHVDAAVGGAFRLSDRLRPLVEGIEHADSVTVDLHKLWWQPIGASALLVRDATALDVVREPSDYLDRDDDRDDGVLNLVGRSLDTSRRFDALKILVSLRATGRRTMAAMLEHLVETAAATAAEIVARPDLELITAPSTVMVAFRWRPYGMDLDDRQVDAANTAIQRALFARGEAVLGRTRIDGRVALKLTLVNPLTSPAATATLLDLVEKEGTAWR